MLAGVLAASPIGTVATSVAGQRHPVNAARLRARRHAEASSWHGLDFDPLDAPERETSMYTTGYTQLDQCDTRSHEGSGSKRKDPGWCSIPSPSGACREVVTTCAKPPEKSKGSPNRAGEPDQAKVGRVNL